jgi:diacylglycerol kinase family enzyme
VRALLVVNPNATSTTGAARDVIAAALGNQLDLRVVHTDHRGHAAELARSAAGDGVALVVVHGGDGTVNEVVNGLLGEAAPGTVPAEDTPAIAVVPGGSANVFARSLGLSPDPLEATQQLLEAIAAHSVRKVGLGGADERWFLFNAGLGWDADVVHAVEQRRSKGKEATPGRYFRAAVRHFLRSARHPARLTVEVPGHAPVTGVHMAFLSGSDPWTYFGDREVHTNPTTTPDAGLGLFGVTSLGPLTIGRVVPQMLGRDSPPRARRLLRMDDVAEVRVRCAEPTGLQLDGEYLGLRSEVHFYRVPLALGVLVPPALNRR